MLNAFILLLPCGVSLVFAIILLSIRGKTKAQRYLAGLAILSAAYFFLDANFATGSNSYNYLSYLGAIAQFLTPTFLAIIFIYLSKLTGRDHNAAETVIMFTPGIFLGCAAAVLFPLIGIDNVTNFVRAHDLERSIPEAFQTKEYELVHTFTMVIYNIVLAVWLAVLTTKCCVIMKKRGFRFRNVIDFFRSKKVGDAVTLQCAYLIGMFCICMVRVALGRHFLMDHLIFSWCSSLLLAFALGAALSLGTWHEAEAFTINGFRKDIPEEAPVENPEISPEAENEAAAPIVVRSHGILQRFEEYMRVEKPYLDPTLTIEKVSHDLGSNRTYISALIRDNYNTSFRSYINELRIRTAQQELLADPDAVLTDIAARSGFASDSQLVRKFTEIIGTPPRAWLNKTR